MLSPLHAGWLASLLYADELCVLASDVLLLKDFRERMQQSCCVALEALLFH